MNTRVFVAAQQIRPLAERMPEPAGPLGLTREFRTNDIRATDYRRGPQTVPTVPIEGTLVERIVDRQPRTLWQVGIPLDVSPLLNLPKKQLEEGLRQACGAVALDLVSRQGSVCDVVAFFEKGEHG